MVLFLHHIYISKNASSVIFDRFAATSEGNKCWCGNTTSGLGASSSCNTDCTGVTDNTKCGGTFVHSATKDDENAIIEQFSTPDLIEGLTVGDGGKPFVFLRSDKLYYERKSPFRSNFHPV